LDNILSNTHEEFYMSTIRYHLTTPKKCTTISMDTIISDLIAIKLGFSCASNDTHSAVRKQLEKLILPLHDPKSPYYDSYYANFKPTLLATKHAILWLVDEELTEKYYEYKVNSIDG
jgi:hypothetical protein